MLKVILNIYLENKKTSTLLSLKNILKYNVLTLVGKQSNGKKVYFMSDISKDPYRICDFTVICCDTVQTLDPIHYMSTEYEGDLFWFCPCCEKMLNICYTCKRLCKLKKFLTGEGLLEDEDEEIQIPITNIYQEWECKKCKEIIKVFGSAP